MDAAGPSGWRCAMRRSVGKFLRCDSTVLGKELTYARLVPPGLMHREGMFVAEDRLTLALLSSSLLNTNKLSA